MTARKKQIVLNLIAFAVLFLVSLYRQLSLRLLPQDPFRTWILYACYVLLFGTWIVSLQTRISQNSMRRFLILEALVMLGGLTIRFLQDTFWVHDIQLTRTSGLWIESTLLLAMTLGILASLGIGQWDQFHLGTPWYLLLVFTGAATWLSVTDERRHFLFSVDPSEPQPNLNFHPHTGIYLLAALAAILLIWRILIIYRRNCTIISSPLKRWAIALLEPVLLAIFSFRFFMPAPHMEVIELFARLYYIEVLTWEIYMYIGFIPVNTDYPEIFRHATVGMQIIGDDGYTLVSATADKVTPQQLQQLQYTDHIITRPGKELHRYAFPGGLLLWNKDVSQLQEIINDLNQSAETLTHKGTLLTEELRTRNEETRLMVKNQIYDELTREIKDQLDLMTTIIETRPATGRPPLESLYLLGTYVKQRCNLRLIQKDTGQIPLNDLRISFEAMAQALTLIGIHTRLDWQLNTCTPDQALQLFDALEQQLEQISFPLRAVHITLTDTQASYVLEGDGHKQVHAETSHA